MPRRSRPDAYVIIGAPGSGKSSVAKLLAKAAGFDHHSAGGRFRDLADENHMPLAEFRAFAQENPGVDQAIDDYLLDKLRAGKVVVDGRAVAHLARREGVAARIVRLEVSPLIAAQRIARRDQVELDVALADNDRRDEEDAGRYRLIYGLDMRDAVQDLTISTDQLTPEQVVAQILELS